MPQAVDAYREGYDKGRAAGITDAAGDAIFGLLRDDPGGYYAAGYRDGAVGKKFNPAPEKSKTQARSNGSSASPLEKSWYWLCNSTEFIPKNTVDQFFAALKAEGSTVAYVIGLSDFTEHTCPRCGSSGHFKIHFLGSIAHASCGWKGHMRTGSYIGHQVAQIFHAGVRAGGAMKEDADNKGDRSGGWIGGILVFLVTAMFRAALAVVLIPIHIIVVLCQPKPAQSQPAKTQ